MASKEEEEKKKMAGVQPLSEALLESNSESEAPRETWNRKIDFMLSCIGYAVGLGNIWRFPYLCYRNGGGAFLIPYFIFLVICGIPLFFLELSFGQFAALGPVAIWKACPLFKGIGYSMMTISFIVCIYYNVIIAYSLHYIFNSFTTGPLPWSKCGNYWNTEICRDRVYNANITSPPEWTGLNCSKGAGWFEDNGTTLVQNITINGSCRAFSTAAQEYFSRKVLRITDSIDVVGGMQWELVGLLVLAWIVVFVCLFKGVKWSGKVVYFTATFPYAVLITLLIVGVQQEGAPEGIRFYLQPNVTKLGDIRVWSDAAVQIFYSLGAAWGVLMSYSSLNKFNNNVYRDAISICTINCLSSVLAGFVVFSVLGSLAHQTGSEVKDVVDQGAGLAFVAYPAAVANLPFAPFWAFLFFFMLFNLGLDSQFGMIEAVVCGLSDEYTWLRKNKAVFIGCLCLIQFVLAIPMVTESGMYWVTLIDWYASGFPLMVVALGEIFCIAWIYGVDRFLYDIKCMIGHRPFLWQYWKTTWMIITPTCIFGLIITHLSFYTPVTYNKLTYPSWSEVLGWLSAMLSVIMIPGWAAYQLKYHPRAQGSLMQRFKAMLKCDDTWGPADKSIPYKYSINKNLGHLDEERSLKCCGEVSTPSTHSAVSDPPSYS